MRYHKEPIPLPGPPPKWLELPEYVRVCDICHGNGKDKDGYKACWCCRRDNHYQQGTGYIYDCEKPVPDSVLNQINVERDRVQAIVDALEGYTIKSYVIHHGAVNPTLKDLLDEWS